MASRRRASSVRGCTIPGCEGTMFKAGYCSTHWQTMFVGPPESTAAAAITTTVTPLDAVQEDKADKAKDTSNEVVVEPTDKVVSEDTSASTTAAGGDDKVESEPTNDPHAAPPPASTVGKGKLTFTVCAARGLKQVNKLKAGSDVYVQCGLGVYKGRDSTWQGMKDRTTKVITGSTEPVWDTDSVQRVQADNCWVCPVKNTASVNTLHCAVYAKRSLPLPDLLLGSVDVDLVSLPKNILVDDWYPLTSSKSSNNSNGDDVQGELHLYVQFDTEKVTRMERTVEKTKAGLFKGVAKTGRFLKKVVTPSKKSGI